MYDKLNEFKEKKIIVALYTNENDGNAFSVGYICEVKQDKLLMLNIGVHGEYDGYTAMEIDIIFRIETKSKYLDKIKKLTSFDITRKMLKVVQNDIFSFLLDKAINDQCIFAIQYNNESEIRGYVKQTKDVLTIVEIDEYGYEDGENIINQNSINKIAMDDIECRDLEKLYKINKCRG